MGSLKGYKTYITAALAVLTAWVAWLTGDLDTQGAVQATFGAVMAATLRHGMSSGTAARLIIIAGIACLSVTQVGCTSTTRAIGAVAGPIMTRTAAHATGASYLRKATTAAGYDDRRAEILIIAGELDAVSSAGFTRATLAGILAARLSGRPPALALAATLLTYAVPLNAIDSGRPYLIAIAAGLRGAAAAPTPVFPVGQK